MTKFRLQFRIYYVSRTTSHYVVIARVKWIAKRNVLAAFLDSEWINCPQRGLSANVEMAEHDPKRFNSTFAGQPPITGDYGSQGVHHLLRMEHRPAAPFRA